jgi:UDP-N-acetylglucosamine 2-epimerase
MRNSLHVFIGTKAQYIKTAPLLRSMQRAGIDYNLIDSGQHAEFAKGLRKEFLRHLFGLCAM